MNQNSMFRETVLSSIFLRLPRLKTWYMKPSTKASIMLNSRKNSSFRVSR